MRTTDSYLKLADEGRMDLMHAKYVLGVSASRCDNDITKQSIQDLRDKVESIILDLEPIAYAR